MNSLTDTNTTTPHSKRSRRAANIDDGNDSITPPKGGADIRPCICGMPSCANNRALFRHKFGVNDAIRVKINEDCVHYNSSFTKRNKMRVNFLKPHNQTVTGNEDENLIALWHFSPCTCYMDDLTDTKITVKAFDLVNRKIGLKLYPQKSERRRMKAAIQDITDDFTVKIGDEDVAFYNLPVVSHQKNSELQNCESTRLELSVCSRA